jgi:GNAT superfamily N-acetyltransferase
MRMAFGTFLRLPDPMAFAGDADYVRGRWTAAPDTALTAEIDGELVGSNFVTRWGSVGFFGPLTVDPLLRGQGVAQTLMDSTMEIMDSWDLTHAVCSHSATAQSTWAFTSAMDSTRDSSPLCCRHR